MIAPWNFPVNFIMGPLAGILAAGNRAMVKTNEFTPTVSALSEDLVGRYFAPDELVFLSGGPEVGQAFAALPLDHLLFTGATGVGRHILRAAADNLTPVTLELGGKSPVIVGRSANVAQAAERIVLGKMLNAGQACLAPDYLLVPEELEDAVAYALAAAAAVMYPDLRTNPDYTAIINASHHDRLTGWLDDAAAKGATLTAIPTDHRGLAGDNARKLPLTLVRDCTDEMIVMQEEIFGPILPIRRYGDTARSTTPSAK